MSDSGAEADAEGADAFENLKSKHRQEKKQLQSTIYHLRKTCSKKEKGSLQDKISCLERELKDKQQKELEDLHSSLSFTANNTSNEREGGDHGGCQMSQSQTISNGLANLSIGNSAYVGDDEDEDPDSAIIHGSGSQSQPKKKGGGKAQRRREKAERAHLERLEKQKQQSEAVECSNALAEKEMSDLRLLLASRDLSLVDVPADGDCFYHAILKQLKTEESSPNNTTDVTTTSVPTVLDLRIAVSKILLDRESEFAAFFDISDTNCEAKSFKDYCEKIRSTHEWAGHLEITAMSHHLNRPIEIVQANSDSILIGQDVSANQKHEESEAAQKNIVLVYHKHLLKCGEHYNLALPIN